MRCPCGYELEDDYKFCPVCARKVTEPLLHPGDATMDKHFDLILTIGEAADFLKCSTRAIHRLIKQNAIPYFTVGTSIRFRTVDLFEWAGQQTQLGKE